MDHAMGFALATVPGHLDRTYFGNRPTGFYIPRFRNVTEAQSGFVRGYGMQGSAPRESWRRGLSESGVGAELKARLRQAGPWLLILVPFAECLPRDENQVALDEVHRDPLGLPQLKIDVSYGPNELALVKDGVGEAERMISAFGGTVLMKIDKPTTSPGGAIHEMGGACMGRDPSTSVLNARNQMHDAPNVFVTDGAAMSSSACQNPSLTYMALTARACDAAVTLLRTQRL